MERTLKELTDIESVCGVYDIYKHCMYMPTKEKFISKMTEYIADPGVKIYICLCSGEIKGVIAVSFSDSNQAEIFGIATDDVLNIPKEIHFGFDDFGWECDTHHSIRAKANYLYTCLPYVAKDYNTFIEYITFIYTGRCVKRPLHLFQ